MKKTLSFGALVAVILVSTGARAQTSTVQVTLATGQDTTVGRKECLSGDTIKYQYSVTNVVTNTKLWIWATTESSCGDSPGTNAITLFAKATVTSGSATGSGEFAINRLVANCPEDTRTDMKICSEVFNTPTGGSESISNRSEVTVEYSSKRPTTPTLDSAEGGDRTIHVRWNGEDVAKYIIYYMPYGPTPTGSEDECAPPEATPQPDAGLVEDAGTDAGPTEADAGPTDGGVDGGTTADAGTPTTSATDVDVNNPPWQSMTVDGTLKKADLTNLRNNQWYRIRVVAQDAAENNSFQSNELQAQPLLVWDFFRHYRCAGGNEGGGFGCSAAGTAATLIPVAGLALAALLRRRAARRPQ